MTTKTLRSAEKHFRGPVETDTPLFQMLQQVARQIAKRLRKQSNVAPTIKPRTASRDQELRDSNNDDAMADS